MPKIHSIVKIFLFVVVGIVTIIVGAFMLRGNMHLWDRNTRDKDKTDSQ